MQPSSSGSKPDGLPLTDPRSISRAPRPCCARAGIDPACSAWKADALCRSAKGGTRRKVRGVEPWAPREAWSTHRSTAFGAAAIASWLDLPYHKLRRQESNLRQGG